MDSDSPFSKGGQGDLMFRRKIFLINKKMQIKYAVRIGVVLILMYAIAQIYTYYSIRTILPGVYSQRMARDLAMIQQKLLVGSVVYIAFIVFFSIFVSHKIAGPTYKIEKTVREILDSGDFSKKIWLRKGDELTGLAQLLNELFEKINKGEKQTP